MHADAREALRYLGAGEALLPEAQAMMARVQAGIRPLFRWKLLAVQDLSLPGRTAETMLQTCPHVCILVATLGLSFDAMLRSTQARSMADAVIMDACGSALIEAVCDEAEREISARFPDLYLTDRFSPGYGDLPLDLQPELLRLTDAQRTLGVTVTPSFLLHPSKTVTALIGLSDRPQEARIRGCVYCRMKHQCPYQGGKRCAL